MNRGIKDLQSSALPLGYVAVRRCFQIKKDYMRLGAIKSISILGRAHVLPATKQCQSILRIFAAESR